MGTKQGFPYPLIAAGLIILILIAPAVYSLKLLSVKPETSVVQTNSDVQVINQLRYDLINAEGSIKKDIAKVLKYKIQKLNEGVATKDMLDLLKVL